MKPEQIARLCVLADKLDADCYNDAAHSGFSAIPHTEVYQLSIDIKELLAEVRA